MPLFFYFSIFAPEKTLSRNSIVYASSQAVLSLYFPIEINFIDGVSWKLYILWGTKFETFDIKSQEMKGEENSKGRIGMDDVKKVRVLDRTLFYTMFKKSGKTFKCSLKGSISLPSRTIDQRQ